MPMAECEQILAEFQPYTGKDHIEECIAILEQCNWNQAVSAKEHLVVRHLWEDHWCINLWIKIFTTSTSEKKNTQTWNITYHQHHRRSWTI